MSGLSFDTRESLFQHAGSFVAACRLFVVVFGLLSSCGVRGPEHVGSVVCGTQALSLRHASSVVMKQA